MRPHLTVATVVPRGGTWLMVEEWVDGVLRLNQPAGHVEAGESLLAAAARETLEETGWEVEATGLIGVFRARLGGEAYVRFAFAARPLQWHARPLDVGIVRALWLSGEEVMARKAEHRSPLVAATLEAYRSQPLLPLSALREIDRC